MRPEDEARKLLKKLVDSAKLDHAKVYIPCMGWVLVELPKGKR